MTKFYITARVNGTDYMTKVEAESASQAEHMILDKGVCAAGEYGCDACMAWDAKAMKTDAFIGAAMWAEPVKLDELLNLINENNKRLMKKEYLAKAIREKSKAIEDMSNQMDAMMEAIRQMKKELASM